jgi:hypothetical protein
MQQSQLQKQLHENQQENMSFVWECALCLRFTLVRIRKYTTNTTAEDTSISNDIASDTEYMIIKSVYLLMQLLLSTSFIQQ